MCKNKKQPRDMTTEEIAKAVFPKKVHEELKRIAHKDDESPKPKSSLQK
jgi:hypothetical protein